MTDIRDAFRTLRSTPVVTTVAILSLALGIGANTAIFSILDTLLLRSLPVKAPQELAIITHGSDNDSFTYPIWEEVRKRSQLFADVAAWTQSRFDTAQGGQARFVSGMLVSGRFFDVVGVPPILGRAFTDADDARGGGPDGAVAMISYGYWQSQFGGAADAIGRSIVLDRVTFTIVGVTPPEFFGPEVGSRFDVALPFGAEPLLRGRESILDNRLAWWLSMMVRRKPGQGIDSAIAALRGVQPQIREATIPPNYRPSDTWQYLKEPLTLVPAATGSSYLRTRYQRPLTTIQVVVGLVLLIACANIANLLLARANARRHEMSVRRALGASRLRLARQLLCESLVLAAAGAVLGLAFAQWGSRLLVRQLSTATNTVFLDLSIDWRVLAFTAGAAMATALLFGTAPAWRGARVEPNEALKEQGRGVHGDARLGLGNVLVVLQVALSLVLIVAAGLFVRTFTQLAGRSLGFDKDRVLVVSTQLRNRDLDPADRPAMFERLRHAAMTVPGAESAALSEVTPVGGNTWQFLIEIPGPEMKESDRVVHVNIISPDFFRTFGTRMLAGRDFTDADKAGTPPVLIVNETFARKYFAGTNPIGRHVKQTGFPGRPSVTREVVGYVEDAVYRNLRQTIPPTMYIPTTQRETPSPLISISVRSASGSPALLTRSVAAALQQVTPDLTLTFRTVSEQVRNSLTQERMIAMLSGFFGALALLLAAIGLYGITSYAVARRRTEIGIRMALGAAPGGVVRLVLARVAWLVACGVVAGAAVTYYASTFVATLLFGLTPRDPATLVAAALILGSIGALAGWIPAFRASRIDPARVLREG
jgi:putative ABC transport system permease protein